MFLFSDVTMSSNGIHPLLDISIMGILWLNKSYHSSFAIRLILSGMWNCRSSSASRRAGSSRRLRACSVANALSFLRSFWYSSQLDRFFDSSETTCSTVAASRFGFSSHSHTVITFHESASRACASAASLSIFRLILPFQKSALVFGMV